MPADLGDSTEHLDADEVRARAASGAALIGARAALVYALGIGANLVLASLLVPRDFGLVALGTVLVVVGGYLADGGFGAALIRRDAPPARAELEAVNALQVGATGAAAVLVAAAAAPVGRDGLVVASMVASLPIIVLRTPSVIVLERNLRYRVIATADVAEALAYYVWAVVAVALGAGVWGMATGVVVRSVVGSSTVIARGPVGLLRPRWSWHHVRPLLGFGAKFQATAVLQILREQLLNVGVAAVAGVATLGVWSLAWRVLQIPNLLFMTVSRISFPAMSRLIGHREDPSPVIERGVAVLAALTGGLIVGLIGFAPALPDLVGHRWHAVPAVILLAGLGLIVGAPTTVATAGYLFAADAAGSVAIATLASSAVWFGLGLSLLPSLGAPAMGIGWLAASVVNAAVLGRQAVARTGAAIAGHAAVPTAIGLAAAAAGWLVSHQVVGVLGGVAGLAAGELLLLAGLALVSRAALRDTRLVVRQALRSFRRAPAAVGSPLR
jgi:O-antigen/teichoic acid export membrane protein